MPRLCHGFDMEQFLNHCRMTKPPYECPHASCGRVYRSLSGIQNHMTSFDHENPPPTLGTPKAANSLEAEPLPIPMSTDLKMVEFELDGKIANLSVYDSIEIVSKEHFEASLPPVLEEPPTHDLAKTPPVKPHTKNINPKTPKNRSVDKDRGVDVQRYTIEEKKSQKLPEAAFKIIPDYYSNLPDAPKRPDTYYRFVEKTVEELDEEVEYDMDEEDRAWLNIINEKRAAENLDLVSMENFELLMDRLEKESFFQAQSSGRETGAPIDEDAVCCICMDGECQNSNVILFCDMCNLAVHQECYGVPYIPEGQWLCRRCLQSPSRAVDCALCPNKGGAFKQTDDGRWAHVVCAMWIPEVCFANTVFLEPIDSIGNIPPARWKLTCYICVQRGVGACIQCNKVNCYTAFHVTCAQQAGLHMKIDAIRETNAIGTSVTVRKAAYCDMHTPADSDARPQVEEMMDAAKKAAAKAASRQKMKKARKILAEKRSAAPIVSVPILPADRIQQLANLINIEKRSLFIHRLLAFWTLKRQSRNGVPLLRRLTTSYSRRNNNSCTTNNNATIINNSNNAIKGNSPKNKVRSPEDVKAHPKKEERDHLWERDRFGEEIKYWQRLRQDLERARLLCELIRKREKTKRELVKAKAEERFVQLAPFVHLLLQKIDQIQDKDTQQIFAEPVDFEEVPDYLDVVKHPMDLSTMRQKAQAHQYQNVDQFASDFELMIDNCLTYNAKDTIFYRAAIKLRDAGGAIIRQLARDVENIGFDPDTGLLLPHRPKHPPEQSEHAIIKEVDHFLDSEPADNESLEARKEKLLNLLDKANLIKHHVSRIKRVKLIRREIGIVRRKMALSESGSGPSAKNVVNSESEDCSERDDTDMDDSSVIDDEAEPGCPSRPSSPLCALPSAAPPTVGVSLMSKLPLSPSSHSPPSSPLHRSALSRKQNGPVSSFHHSNNTATKKRLKNTDIKQDVTQKRIDSYFSRSDDVSHSVPGRKCEVNKFTRENKSFTEKEEYNSRSEIGNTVSTWSPRKRGRPPRVSTQTRLPTTTPVTLGGNSKEDKKEVTKLKPDKETHPKIDEVSNSLSVDEPMDDTTEEPAPAEHSDVPGDEAMDDSLTSVPSSPSGVNRRTSVLFTKKAGALFKKTLPEDVSVSSKTTEADEASSLLDLGKDASLTKESFKIYRQGGEIAQETDEETQSESNSNLTDSEDESGSESDSEEGGTDSDSSGAGAEHGVAPGQNQVTEQIPLEPLDLVWAKCRGYPWYPALIINPKMPRTGYFHNHVPIPVPPDEVLAHASNYHTPMYLVLFFDQKRTWQWLPRNKLEPLGENFALDKAKLVESRKPADRKAVKKAYEKAILHRCRVTGENTGLSGESDAEENHP